MQHEPKASYRAYLLRIWRVQSERGPLWRASLEDARTGERRGFPDLEALYGFLQESVKPPEGRSDAAAEE
jgi:hypothetical protein